MNVSRVALTRFIIRGALENNPADPKAALKAILKSRFASEVTNGTTIVSKSSDGHSISFHLPDSLRPAEVMVLAEEALTWLEAQPDVFVGDQCTVGQPVSLPADEFSRHGADLHAELSIVIPVTLAAGAVFHRVPGGQVVGPRP